jgi:Rrf2 family protein
MQISTRFSVSIHILLGIVVFGPNFKVTSGLIASSVKTNSVIIRRLMGQLKKSGLIHTTRGNSGGIELAIPAGEITLLDIYQAVEPDLNLIPIHEDTEQACPVGGNIQTLLSPVFVDIEESLKRDLMRTTLADLVNNLSKLIG